MSIMRQAQFHRYQTVEVTPKSMRMRKVILDETERKRANKNA